jgi:hypothetical protein
MVGRSSGRTRGGLSDPPHPAKKPRATTKIPDGYRGATRERDATTREPNTRRHDTRRHGNIRKVIARKHRDGDDDTIAHRNHRRHARGHAHSHAGGRRLRSSVAAAAAAARRRGDSAAQCDTWAAAWCSRHRTRRATHGGPVTGTGFLFPIPRKYGDPVGPTPVSPRPRKTPVNGGPVQTRTPVNGDGEPP